MSSSYFVACNDWCIFMEHLKKASDLCMCKDCNKLVEPDTPDDRVRKRLRQAFDRIEECFIGKPEVSNRTVVKIM